MRAICCSFDICICDSPAFIGTLFRYRQRHSVCGQRTGGRDRDDGCGLRRRRISRHFHFPYYFSSRHSHHFSSRHFAMTDRRSQMIICDGPTDNSLNSLEYDGQTLLVAGEVSQGDRGCPPTNYERPRKFTRCRLLEFWWYKSYDIPRANKSHPPSCRHLHLASPLLSIR